MTTSPIRFREFELDLARFELRREGRILKLEKIPMELLILLVEKEGELVTREEIVEKLWGPDVFLDVERAINTAMYKIRTTFNDDPDQPRFVQTVVGKGYRFIAPLEVGVTELKSNHALKETLRPGQEVPDDSLKYPVHQASIEGEPGAGSAMVSSPEVFSSVRVRWAGWGLVGLALLMMGLAVWTLHNRREQRNRSGRIESIAVLPLDNLSHDPEQEYFADGMTDELITRIAQTSPLRVISRTSIMQYLGTRKPLPQIARELNVDAVVEGTVARAGDRVRITAQLIDARQDRHLWAQSYEGDLRDVLVLQDAVARAIANEVQAKITPQDQARVATAQRVNPTAYEAYLKGRFFWNKRTESDLRKAIEFFGEALAADATYAAAFSGLVDCYTALGYGSYLSPQESLPKAKAAAMNALQLNPSAAEPHASLGYARLYYDWDWAGAEKEF